jgi:hypothetical protein
MGTVNEMNLKRDRKRQAQEAKPEPGITNDGRKMTKNENIWAQVTEKAIFLLGIQEGILE